MTPDQASKLRIAIHRLVRAEREYAILGCGSRVVCRKHQAAIAALIREATGNPQDATNYQWLRAQHWTDNTLVCVEPGNLLIGVMTLQGKQLDQAIAYHLNPKEKTT